jgi:hypothetical protein
MLSLIIPIPKIIFMGLFAMGPLAGPLTPVFCTFGFAFGIVVLPFKVLAGFALDFFWFFVFKQIVFI